MLYWLLPSLRNQKTNRVATEGGGFLGVAGGNWGGSLGKTGTTSAAPPAATGRSTFPKRHRPKNPSILQRDIHLIEIKYCEDTRPQNQLSAMQEQHEGLCTTRQGWSLH